MLTDLNEQWMSAQQAATKLGVSRPRIHQMAAEGLLRATKVAGRMFVSRDSVDSLAERRRTAPRRGKQVESLEDVVARREVIWSLARVRGARSIKIFGSIAKGEARPGSDIDFLVEMEPGRSALDLAGLSLDLEEALGRRVDLVEINRSSKLGARIMDEAVAL